VWLEAGTLPGRRQWRPTGFATPGRFPLALLAPHLKHPSSASAPGKQVDTDLNYRGVMPVISLWDLRTVQLWC